MCSLIILCSAVCGHVFGGGVALETDYAERVGSYAFKASLSEITYPTFNLLSFINFIISYKKLQNTTY